MRLRAILFASLLIIPLVAFVIARTTQASYEEALREGVEAQSSALAPDDQREFDAIKDSITLRNICSSSEATTDFGFGDVCGRYRNLDRISWHAVATVLAPIAFLAVVAVAGRAARSNRRMLLSLFRPLLAATLVMVVIIALSQAALALAAVYYGIGEATGRIPGRLMYVFAIGALAGVWSIVRVVPRAFEPAEARVLGKSVTETGSPDLWREVRELCARIDTDAPDAILAGLDPTFFVTEVNVLSLDGKHSGRTLFLSLPLLRVLTIDELKGVIGHEMGHFKGEDTRYSQRFYPIYRGASDSLEAAYAHAVGGLSGLTMWPVVAMLSSFLGSFAVAESATSRERELAADEVGAAVGGVGPFTSALVKAHAYGGAWVPVVHLMIQALGEGKQITNASEVFETFVRGDTDREWLADLDEKRLPHPTDSHPPLAVRLEALGVEMDNVREAELATEPERPAIELVQGHEEIEEAVSESHTAMLAQAGHPIGRRTVKAETDESPDNMYRGVNLAATTSGSGESFLRQLNELIDDEGETLVALSAVDQEEALPWLYFLARSTEDVVTHLVAVGTRLDVVDAAAFQSPQLPIRGRADDSFLQRAMVEVPDGASWLFALVDDDTRWAASGATHDQLRSAVSTVRGREAAFGHEPAIPIGGASDVLVGLIDLSRLESLPRR